MDNCVSTFSDVFETVQSFEGLIFLCLTETRKPAQMACPRREQKLWLCTQQSFAYANIKFRISSPFKILDEIGETDADAIIINMEEDDSLNDDPVSELQKF